VPDIVEVPAELAEDIGYENPNPWPWFLDRDACTWAETPYTYAGEPVLFSFSGERPATRSSVEAVYGPLVPEPHCPVCGSIGFWKDGVCGMRTVSSAHPNG